MFCIKYCLNFIFILKISLFDHQQPTVHFFRFLLKCLLLYAYLFQCSPMVLDYGCSQLAVSWLSSCTLAEIITLRLLVSVPTYGPVLCLWPTGCLMVIISHTGRDNNPTLTCIGAHLWSCVMFMANWLSHGYHIAHWQR